MNVVYISRLEFLINLSLSLRKKEVFNEFLELDFLWKHPDVNLVDIAPFSLLSEFSTEF